MTAHNKGLQLAFLTALISGVSIFINKFAVGFIKPPLVFTATKNLGVGLLILSLLFATKKLPNLAKLTKKQLRSLILIGIVGGSAPFYLFFTGLSQTSAINGALIHKTLILWVALLAVPFLKEQLNKLQAVGIFVLFISNLFVGGFTGFEFSKGELFILFATILWAIENVIAKKVLVEIDADIVTLFRMGIGSVILVIASAFVAPQALFTVFKLNGTQYFWLFATMLSLFAYVFTWYKALKLAPATLVSSVLVSATLVTNVLSAIFVTKTFNLLGQLPQISLLVLGLAIYLIASKKQLTLNQA